MSRRVVPNTAVAARARSHASPSTTATTTSSQLVAERQKTQALQAEVDMLRRDLNNQLQLAEAEAETQSKRLSEVFHMNDDAQYALESKTEEIRRLKEKAEKTRTQLLQQQKDAEISQHELKTARERNKTLEKELSVVQQVVGDTSVLKEAAEATATSQSEVIAALRLELSNTQKSLAATERKVLDADEETRVLRTKLQDALVLADAEAEREERRLSSAGQVAAAAVEAMKADIEKAGREHAEEIARLKEKLEEVESQAMTAAKLHAEKMTALRDEHATSMETATKVHANKLDAVRQELREAEEALVNAEASTEDAIMASASEAMHEAQLQFDTAVAEEQGRAAAAAAAATAAQRQASEAQAQLLEVREQLANMMEREREASERAALATLNLEKSQRETATCRDELTVVSTEADRLQKKLQKVQGQLRDAQHDASTARKEMIDVRGKMDAAVEAAHKATQAVEHQSRKALEADERAKKAAAENNKNIAELQRLSLALSTDAETIRTLRAENESLAKGEKEARDELSELRTASVEALSTERMRLFVQSKELKTFRAKTDHSSKALQHQMDEIRQLQSQQCETLSELKTLAHGEPIHDANEFKNVAKRTLYNEKEHSESSVAIGLAEQWTESQERLQKVEQQAHRAVRRAGRTQEAAKRLLSVVEAQGMRLCDLKVSGRASSLH